MRKIAVFVLSGCLLPAFAAEDRQPSAKVEATMTVSRCQAVLEDGSQCPHQAGRGETRCWRHRGAVRAMKETCSEAGKGAGAAWHSTKTWSTNAFEKTRQGAGKALKSTQEAFEEAGEELTKLVRENFKKDTKNTVEKK